MATSLLVSCVIPVYNGERHLREAIESVLAQSFTNTDVIVADDGSTDGSMAIAGEYAPRVRVVAQETAGPAATRNLGLRHAGGDLVAFLDADDLWHPQKLERQLARFDVRPELEACVTHACMFWSEEWKGEAEYYRDHARAGALPGYATTTLLARRRLFDRIGDFEPELWFSDATDWFLRATERGVVMEMLPDVLTYHRMHGGNLTRRRSAESREEFLRIVKASLDRRRAGARGRFAYGRGSRRAGVELTKKRILVTGGAGFLGRYVVRELRERGVAPERIFVPRSAQYDLRRQEAVERLYADARPDIVVHLAARVGGIGANRRHPGQFFYDNLIMGAELMEVGRQREVEKFVAVGTICAYPKLTAVPFRETSLWGGYPEETNAPYGIAKKVLLVQAQAYRAEYGMNAIYLLPVNLYGPGDNFEPESSHVIPALIRRCLEARDGGDESMVCWGDGSPTREFLFVADAARAIVLAAELYDGSEPVNVGSGVEISIRHLACEIAGLTGYHGGLEWDPSQPNGQPRRCVDTSRAREAFGFEASTPLRDGLAESIAWYERERAAQRHGVSADPDHPSAGGLTG
ncbi:MAG: NAD-dependent epimerase/dehydratase family protein [Gemmatimonadaceae bacterium]